ncbi:FixH family protein [Dyadobacter psychrophilus]|uniref:FixH protein n=1 Tax=Dyadobacter psychrophilus TaxID=651661 RepID=A0A1T5DB67_9BACT|nr:FixH family protein [Dyadobacter psychrophilus]SKB68856.1 FixH protein [Dyadobacter psychrophilus]
MKINWGVGITALYMGFVAMILVLVSMSIGQKIDLVTEHYYEEELGFQNKIDKKQRAAALAEPVKWQVTSEGISIVFPGNVKENDLAGAIHLYCPSNDKNDRKFKISTQNHTQIIPVTNIPEGSYHLQIDWKNKEQTYWNEDVIVISHTK